MLVKPWIPLKIIPWTLAWVRPPSWVGMVASCSFPYLGPSTPRSCYFVHGLSCSLGKGLGRTGQGLTSTVVIWWWFLLAMAGIFCWFWAWGDFKADSFFRVHLGVPWRPSLGLFDCTACCHASETCPLCLFVFSVSSQEPRGHLWLWMNIPAVQFTLHEWPSGSQGMLIYPLSQQTLGILFSLFLATLWFCGSVHWLLPFCSSRCFRVVHCVCCVLQTPAKTC